MGYFIGNALNTAAAGLAAFVGCFRPPPNEPEIRLESVDRYFCRVGGYLIDARNRFEREYMGERHADV